MDLREITLRNRRPSRRGAFTSLTLRASFSGIAATQPLGTISGTAVDDATGAPLAGVTIKLEYGATATTSEAAGVLRFTGLKPRDYYLEAEKEGFAKRAGTQAPTVRLTPGENRGGLQIRMQPESAVSGRVVDAKGEPVDAMVTLRDERNVHVASALSKNGHK